MKKLVAVAVLLFVGIAFGETYTLFAPGDNSNSTLSFDSAGSWSPATSSAPCAENNYIVAGTGLDAISTIRMNTTPDSKTFGGDSLTLRYGQLNLRVNEVTVDNLIIDTFGRICNQANGIFTFAGKCSLPAGSVLEFWTASELVNLRGQNVLAAIEGSGEIRCTILSDINGTCGQTFNDLSGFNGKIAVASTAQSGANLTVTLNTLPADPEEPMADAISVDYGATLKFADSGTMGANRGFTFTNNGKPIIEVAAGCDVIIAGPVVAPNGFVKKGLGTLALVGDVSGVNREAITISEGEFEYGPDVIVARVNGYDGAVDGQMHSPSVELVAPANGEGCTIQWQVASDDTPTWSTTTPSFSEAGLHIVKYQITCEGRATKCGIVAMRLGGVGVGAVAFVRKNMAARVPYDTPEKATDSLATAASYVFNLELPAGAPRYVVMLPGSYEFTSAVTLENECVVGFGEDRTVISTSGNAACAVALENSEIREITFDGAKNAIQARDGSKVNRCVVRNAFGEYAIRAQGAVTVAATKVVGNRLGGDVDGHNGNAPFVLAAGGASLTVTDSQVCDNYTSSAGASGGVLSVERSVYDGYEVIFDRCVFTNNAGRCGFVRIANGAETKSTLTMRNCLCAGCKSIDVDNAAASVFIFALAGEIVNCTFDDCWADGSLVYVGQTPQAGAEDLMTIHNCIFRNIKNKSGSLEEIGVSTFNRTGDKAVKVDNSVVWPKVTTERLEEKSETNYFEKDVTFVGPGQKLPEYALASGSYGRKLGDPSVWADYPGALDLASKARVVNGKVDVGCYQWQSAVGLVLYFR